MGSLGEAPNQAAPQSAVCNLLPGEDKDQEDVVKYLVNMTFNENENDSSEGKISENREGVLQNGNECQYPLRPYAEGCPFYLRTGTCKFGPRCKFNHPEIRAYRGNEHKKEGNFELKEQIECKYYQTAGGCMYGNACRYRHSGEKAESAALDDNSFGLPKEKDNFVEQTGLLECKYYLTPGGCKYGNACKYIHSKDKSGIPSSELNFLGLPIRMGEKDCPFFMRNGSCGYGVNCRFNHPDPNAARETVSFVPAPKGFGGQYSGNHSGTYGPIAMPVWGETSHQFTYSSVNNAMNKANPSHTEHMQVTEFPERPGRPECSYFLRTGDCKYGSACKFHHPKNQPVEPPAEPPVCPLNKAGLPLRPDRRICQNYERIGLCKYGHKCFFHHPDDYGLWAFPA